MAPLGRGGVITIERLTSSDLRCVLDVLRDAYRLRNRDAFTVHMLHAATSVIPADIATYFSIDRRSWVFTSAATPRGADDFPGSGDAFMRHVREHPLFINHARVSDGRAYKISDYLTRRELHRLPLYNEYYRRIGTEYQMAMALPARNASVVGIALSRKRSDCSERERLLLNALSPHLRQAYESAEAVSCLEERVGRVQDAAGAGDQEVVILRAGAACTATARGRQWLRTYFGAPRRGGDRLPEALHAWVEAQAAHLRVVDDLPAPQSPLRVAREDGELEIRITWHRDETLLLLRERTRRPGIAALASLGLSPRETDVLLWIAEGKGNAEIGTILGMSGRTVGKHLERIYQKLGVETRTAAAARALTLTHGVETT
jgi:DNA-binding CsgD family transcriptional regulator